ncbi:MAG TPA: c-type cytochrome [Gemmatimonadales bacterium]|nr:c-type cytochrome [Gemmatimonadales bacterium]
MKQFLLGVAATLVVLVVGALAYLLLGFAEVRGDQPVTGLERTVMRAAVHASVRRHAPNDSDPVSPTDANLIAGGRAYLNQCAGCHGAPGRDHGPDALTPAPPHLPTEGSEYTEAQIFWVAKHGIRRTGMFANGVWEADSVLWPIATFIKHIKDLPPAVRESLAVRPKH